MSRLQNLEKTFKDDASELTFNTTDGLPEPNIDKTPYQQWTRSDDENEKLKIGKNIIDVIQKASTVTKIYPLTVSQATSGLVRYNVRTNEYFVNPSI